MRKKYAVVGNSSEDDAGSRRGGRRKKRSRLEQPFLPCYSPQLSLLHLKRREPPEIDFDINYLTFEIPLETS